GVQVRLAGQAEDGDVDPAQPQQQRGQQADRAGAQHGGPPRSPDPQPALDLVRLGDALLADGDRLQPHADVFQASGYRDDELGIVDEVLRQIAVAQVDTSFVLGVVGRHVVGADQVVDAHTRSADRRYDIVTGCHLGDVRADLDDLAEALVPEHQKVVAL